MAIARMEHGVSTNRFSLPRLSLETAGLLTLLFGAWAGVVSFVGPIMAFSGDGSPSWHWDLAHAVLFLAPGAAACLAGLIAMIGTAGNSRTMLGAAGLLAAVCGAWLIVGAVAWPVLEGTTVFRTGVPAIREFAYWIGYALGPGAILLGLGAFMLGSDRFQPTMREEITTTRPLGGGVNPMPVMVTDANSPMPSTSNPDYQEIDGVATRSAELPN